MRVWISLFLILVFSAVGAKAQSYTITTFAGPALPVDGVRAVVQAIDNPYSVLADGTGGFFVASFAPSRIYRVRADGTLTIVAGNSIPGFGGDGGPATTAQLNSPTGMALDSAGNLFFADSANNRIRRITPAGTISTVAGTGVAGFAGDGGPAINAQLRAPHAVAVDTAGNLYVADFQNIRVRKISTDGTINTVAGTGTTGFSGDGGLAVSAQINLPESVIVDGSGNLYIADANNHRIRKVTPAGTITTIAGTGSAGFSGDGAAAISAQLNTPYGLALDAAGNLFIADLNNNRIRRVTPAGTISTVAGTGARAFSGDGGPAVNAQLAAPYRVSSDSDGSLFIADFTNNRVRRITVTGTITTVGGNGTIGFSGDGGIATSAQLNSPYGMSSDAAGNVYIADFANSRIRRVSPAGVITTAAGTGVVGFTGDGGPAVNAQIRAPLDVTVDTAGNFYFTDSTNYRVRKVTAAGVISTVAGRGVVGFSGDGGAAINAQFNPPTGIAVDAAGNLFIADQLNHRIRKVTAGVITTVAGTGTAGFSGDGGPATGAQLNSPFGVAVDTLGNLFIADAANHRIRKISSSGIITTVAGLGTAGFSGDGGIAPLAQLNNPQGLAVDAAGNLYIADTNNSRIRRVSATGLISTIAGGAQGFRGDGGPALSAWLSLPRRVAVDGSGNVFVADTVNHRIRELVPVAQSTTTYTVADRGGMSLQTLGTATGNVTVGYARIEPVAGNNPPAGFAIFGFHQNNVLVSEAAVPASGLIRSARIYAEVGGGVNTGLAIANPNDQEAAITFSFTDANGDFGQGLARIPANGQIARFLDQDPFNGRSLMSGTFSFTSSMPVSVVALRGLLNERGEFLLTTLPVTEIGVSPGSVPVLFPHFADGGGWTTQIVLVNPTDGVLSGAIQFRNPAGQSVNFGGPVTNLTYSIAPRAIQKLQTPGVSAGVTTGSISITPADGSAAPAGLAIFSFRKLGIVVSEAGVPAQPAGTAFLVYAESAGDFQGGAAGSMRTGLAIANTSAAATTVVVEVQNLDGTTGLIGTVAVPGNGQTSLFMNEIPGLESLLTPFSGVLRLTSTVPVTMVGLRGRYNERQDLLITTTPPSNENAPPPATGLFFPHIADAGGYVTQFNLFSRGPGQPSSGSLRFFSQSGSALNLVVR